MHPLIGDLSSMSDEDLRKKVSELTKKLGISYRTGNQWLAQQVQMALETYNSEVYRRNEKMLSELSKKNTNFDDIIDIG